MKVVVLIDYDNLLEPQKVSGILDVVTKSLLLLPQPASTGRGSCDIRIYGGWYEGEAMTNLAQGLSASLQNEFPALIRLPVIAGDHFILSANAELAMALVEEPAHHLFNTYRRKGRPKNIRVQQPADVGCSKNTCPLPIAGKLLKTGKCPKVECEVPPTNMVYRHEQKIVDAMLTCDLIYVAQQGYDRIVLVSGDDDFLPPLRTTLLRGATIFRIHPTTSEQRQPLPAIGAGLVELEL